MNIVTYISNILEKRQLMRKIFSLDINSELLKLISMLLKNKADQADTNMRQLYKIVI